MTEDPLLVPGEVIELTLSDVAAGDRRLGRLGNGLVVLVSGTCVPGDTVRARVTVMKSGHAGAELVEILTPAPGRIEPPCPVFGACGGCTWQMLPYPRELEWKHRQVRAAVERIAGMDPDLVHPVLAAPEAYGYRNKIELSVTREGRLALHAAGDPDSLVPVTQCPLATPAINRVMERLDPLLKRESPGIRRVTLREGADEKVAMILRMNKPSRWPEDWNRKLGLGSLSADVPRSGKQISMLGKPVLNFKLLEYRFEVPVRSFFQVHPAQAEVLAGLVRDEAGDGAGRHALDLYCGAGAFSLVLAGAGYEVLGLESDEAAVRSATGNARLNKTKKASFDTLQLGKSPLPRDHYALALLDPPRAGAAESLIRDLAGLAPPVILYVSCDPATFARDAKRLAGNGYVLRKVLPVDMFPRTPHIELLARFEQAKIGGS